MAEIHTDDANVAEIKTEVVETDNTTKEATEMADDNTKVTPVIIFDVNELKRRMAPREIGKGLKNGVNNIRAFASIKETANRNKAGRFNIGAALGKVSNRINSVVKDVVDGYNETK